MSANTVNWGGYEFDVCKQTANWNDVGGIYIFTGLNQQGRWRAFYIGQAQSLKDRIPDHERWDEAVQLGATHVHARAVSQEATRDTVEAELIAAYQPALNEQLK
jgi:excinuclease UvrABC nuclease subunit